MVVVGANVDGAFTSVERTVRAALGMCAALVGPPLDPVLTAHRLEGRERDAEGGCGAGLREIEESSDRFDAHLHARAALPWSLVA